MTAGEIKQEADDTAVTNGSVDENIDNMKEEEAIEEHDDPDNEKLEVNGSHSTPLITTLSDDLLRKTATKLPDSEWKKLASKLNFQEDDIAYFESEHTTCIDRAVMMLTVWKVRAIFC